MTSASMHWSLARGFAASLAKRAATRREYRVATRTGSGSSRPQVRLGRHVAEAMANGEPLVALESTVITHGLPEPQNYHLALELERQVRATSGAGGRFAVPVTIGIVTGQVVIGLSHDEIEYLARRELSQPIKASRRDIPIAVARKLSAGTTVAATMAIACSLRTGSRIARKARKQPSRLEYEPARNMSGTESLIKVFATGGLGGVHEGGHLSMDVSADLYEMARSPLGLVSSGFKSFLDTRRSLEFLETLGCTVMSLHETTSQSKDDEEASIQQSSAHVSHQDAGQWFPKFFEPFSDVKSPCVVEDVEEAAEILYECLEGSGFLERRAALLAVPLAGNLGLSLGSGASDQKERLANEISQIEARKDLEGKEKTPLILETFNRLTGGRSVEANVRLLKNNARIGASLALAYASLQSRERSSRTSGPTGSEQATHIGPNWPKHRGFADVCPAQPEVSPGGRAARGPLVVGCTMIDMHVSTRIDAQFKTNPSHSGATFEGEPHLALGGVGQNLASALELLGDQPEFVTALGSDRLARFALAELERAGLKPGARLTLASDQPGSADPISGTNSATDSSCFALVLIDSISGQCEYVVANLRASQKLDPKFIGGPSQLECKIAARPPILVMDANLEGASMELLLSLAHKHQVPVFLEPTDVNVLPKLVATLGGLADGQTRQALACMSPNVLELQRMLELFDGLKTHPPEVAQGPPGELGVEQIRSMARRLMEDHLPEMRCLLVTMDKRGVLVGLRSSRPEVELADRRANTEAPASVARLLANPSKDHSNEKPNGVTSNQRIAFRHFESPQVLERPVSGSGAGDCFAAGFISGLLGEAILSEAVGRAFQAAALALQSKDPVPQALKSLRQPDSLATIG